jgi:hypothetical protein
MEKMVNQEPVTWGGLTCFLLFQSLSNQQITLSGHLGSRERFGMQGSFILYDSEVVHGLFKSNLGTYCFLIHA